MRRYGSNDDERVCHLSSPSSPTEESGSSVRQEFPHRQRDWLSVRFQREVSGIVKTDISTWNVSLECVRAGGQKERIVFAPHGKERRGEADCPSTTVEGAALSERRGSADKKSQREPNREGLQASELEMPRWASHP